MSYIITLTVEVPGTSVVDAVRAASGIAESVSDSYDNYEVTHIDFKKKPEIPSGFQPHGNPGTIRTWIPPTGLGHGQTL